LAKASSLVSSDLRKSKFYPFKSTLQISVLVLLFFWYFWYSGTSGTLVFWYFGFLVIWYFLKLGFHFPKDLATEKVRSRCQIDPWGRAQLSRVIGS
jgi:hypothetical protein